MGENPGKDYSVLLHHFGGILPTMYTLYKSMTGGIDWGDPAEELGALSPVLNLLYVSFISFSVLCLMNIVTGVFVEHANSITRNDTDNIVMDELANQDRRVEEMLQLFELAAGPGKVDLREEEFMQFSKNRKVQAYFRQIGLNVEQENAAALFRLIDLDGDDCINVREFIDGCAQFIGDARQLD